MANQQNGDDIVGSLSRWSSGREFLAGYGVFIILSLTRELGTWVGDGNVWIGQIFEVFMMGIACWVLFPTLKTTEVNSWYAFFSILAFIPGEMPSWSWIIFVAAGLLSWKMLMSFIYWMRRPSQNVRTDSR